MPSKSALLALVPALLLSTGCVKKMAVNAMADTLSGDGGGAFTQDEDLEFVGEAIPFAIKLMESVHESAPDHGPLQDTLCSSFTQYAVVYVKWPAEQVKFQDYAAYAHGYDRTRGFLRRAQDYCFGGLDIVHPGFSERIYTDTDAVLAEMEVADVPRLYWTGATWLARIAMSKEDIEAIGELPIAEAIVRRGLELDADWDKGALHDLMIQLEPSLPMPGGLERAREHFAAEIALTGGTRAGPYVSLGTSVSIAEQDREEFIALMNQALEVDASALPEDQLGNLYAQEQARYYLDHIDDYFAF